MKKLSYFANGFIQEYLSKNGLPALDMPTSIAELSEPAAVAEVYAEPDLDDQDQVRRLSEIDLDTFCCLDGEGNPMTHRQHNNLIAQQMNS